MKRVGTLFAFAGGTVLLLGAWSAYPLYPTTRSICDLVDARGENPDRWATPQRGAVVLLTGDIFAAPDGQYAFFELAAAATTFGAPFPRRR